MKKELKDYLHLYMGCKINTSINGTVMDGTWYDRIMNNTCDAHLILRPLSDMNGFEAAELIGIGTSVYHWVEIIEIDERQIFFNAFYSGTGKRAWHKWEKFNAISSEQFKFLLSKHFDLFGLIESGLAVNAAELKSVSSR